MGLFTDILKGLPENAVLRSKVADAEERYAALETENAILKDDLRDAKAEIAELKEQIEELTHIENLNEIELKILHRVANLDHDHAVSSVLHRNFFSELTLARVEHHLERLDHLDCIRSDVIDSLGAHYGLTQKGRKILLDNDLL